jgi:hypothetical protein
MKWWHMRIWKYILHVVERVFVEGAFTRSISLGIWGSARFATQIKWAKQMKKKLKN